jgi:acetylornithine/succinyldiaminopimelate/putrescine aminotransferase
MSAHTLHGSTFSGYELAPEVRGYRYHVGGYVATVEEAREKLELLRDALTIAKNNYDYDGEIDNSEAVTNLLNELKGE